MSFSILASVEGVDGTRKRERRWYSLKRKEKGGGVQPGGRALDHGPAL